MHTHYMMRKRIVDNKWRYNLINLENDETAWYYLREDNVFVHYLEIHTIPVHSVINPF